MELNGVCIGEHMQIDKNKYFEVFSFGDSPAMAEKLLNLVLEGKKTATVS